MTPPGDHELAALLAPLERSPDEAFTARVTQGVLADERLSAVRRRTWTRLASDAVGSGSVVLAFLMLGDWGQAGREDVTLGSPAAAALLLLGLWAAVGLRSGGRAAG